VDSSGRSPLTLVVASLSSAAAAVVVRELWGPGTIASAAFMPLLVAVFAELLHHPTRRLSQVARERLHPRKTALASRLDRMLGRPVRWRRVLLTAAGAFLIGSAVLTGWELILHHSLSSRTERTTLWGGSVRPARPRTEPRIRAPSPAVQSPQPARTTTHRAQQTSTRGTAAPTTTTATTTTTTAQGAQGGTTTTATTTSKPRRR
jgi:cytoskeletal protein RodZ